MLLSDLNKLEGIDWIEGKITMIVDSINRRENTISDEQLDRALIDLNYYEAQLKMLRGE